MNTQRLMRWAAGVTLIVGMITFNIATVHGYAYQQCTSFKKPIKWDKTGLTLRANATSFPLASSRRVGLEEAIDRWNDAPGNFAYGTPNYSDEKPSRSNSVSEIWFTSNQDYLDGSPAMAMTSFTCFKLHQADIVFDNQKLWSYSDIRFLSVGDGFFTLTPYGGKLRPFITAALHELGHGFGLQHVNSEYNIMGSDTTHIHANGEKVNYYAGEDGGDGKAFLYGNSGGNDLGVVHWKYGSANGEYSIHVLTGISSFIFPFVSAQSFEGVARYDVFDHFAYVVEFTYENNGAQTLTGIDLGFYISTDNLITTNDQLIGSGVIGSLARNGVHTTKFLVTLPNLNQGQTYWLGAIIDYTGKVNEVNEKNNATFIPIRVLCCN